MQTVFHGKRIASMLGIVPKDVLCFDDEVGNYAFPEKQTMRLKKIMGFDKHRIAKDTSTVSDFAVEGLNHMLKNGWIRKEEIGALVVVTLSPDHFVPQVCNIVQGRCGLPTDVLCLDVAQGCCGFVVGLMQSFMLLGHLGGKKVVLINGDVLSHKCSKKDRNEFPLAGDGTSIVVVENSDENPDIYCEILMDGGRGDVLKIPAGGFRMPSSAKTAELHDTGDGNFRSLDHMHMDGDEVYRFVQQEVPPLVEHLLSETKTTVNDYDLFLLHQPNKFMLQKLAQKAGFPFEKTPMNLVENYGNLSGACIPVVAIQNYKDALKQKKFKCLLSAFGSGLAWCAMTMVIGNLSHCEMLEADL